MTAIFIAPGIYHIRGCGIECNVLARHGVDAVLIGLDLAGVFK